jgi:adenosine kinase
LQTFVLNISAPFIAQFFGTQLGQLLPYVDIVIGNEAEAEAYAGANGISNTTDLRAIARAIALLPKVNASRPRTVIFTHGAEQTVALTADKPDEPKTFSVNALAESSIVDTNGAGDAFAGGFLGALVAGKTLDESVLAGHALAREGIQQIGPQYPWPKVTIL